MHWHGNWRHGEQAIHMKITYQYSFNKWKLDTEREVDGNNPLLLTFIYLRVSDRMFSCMRVKASFFLFKRSRRNEWKIWVSKTCKHTRMSLVQKNTLSADPNMSIYLPFCKRCDLSYLWTGGTPRCWKHDAHSSGSHKLHYRKQKQESRSIAEYKTASLCSDIGRKNCRMQKTFIKCVLRTFDLDNIYIKNSLANYNWGHLHMIIKFS